MNKYFIFCLTIIVIMGCKPNQSNSLIGIWEYDTDLMVFTEKTILYPNSYDEIADYVDEIRHTYTIKGDQLYYETSVRHDYKFKVEGDTLYIEGKIVSPTTVYIKLKNHENSGVFPIYFYDEKMLETYFLDDTIEIVNVFRGSTSVIDEQKWTRRNHTTLQILPRISERPFVRHIFILKTKELNKGNMHKNIIAGDTRFWLESSFQIRKYENKEFANFLDIKGGYYIVLWCPDIEKAYISKRRIGMDKTFIQISFNDFELFENEIINEIARELPYPFQGNEE